MIRFGMTKNWKRILSWGIMGFALGATGCRKQAAGPVANVAAAPSPASAQSKAPDVDPGAEAFVRALYAQYAASGDYSPLMHEDAVFTPALVAMLKHDEKITPKGEMGAIEADPICQCQDDSGMKLQSVAVTGTGDNTADAKVGLLFDKPLGLTLKLLKVPGEGWRVDDAIGQDAGSMRETLKKAKH